MRLCWAGALVSGALLVGLRVGRPVYYTDGGREIAATEVAGAGMLVWQTPEATVELPGPVEGRVTELPDGRLLYGVRTADETTDLVVFDPERPDVPPEPAYGLNTRDNELAPACASDGAIYFASDRDGDDAVGGYDIYRSTWTPRGFTRPAAVVVCNTALDETDPAPSPDGAMFAFVRIDPRVKNGDDGTLLHCRLGSGVEPERVFPDLGTSRRVVDRDPAFSPDGGALWFVRREVGRPLALMRVSTLGDRFDQPVAVGEDWAMGHLRGPLPGSDGMTLGLLQGASDSEGRHLWFVSEAREIYPWWSGQRWLEYLLLGLFATFVLLLVLLHLGRRWRTLDLLAQCLLLSLLVHILLFLWLMGVEITGALMRGNEDGGSLEVTISSVMDASDSASQGSGPRSEAIAALVRFDPTERSFDVSAPTAATERAPSPQPVEASDSQYDATIEAEDAADRAVDQTAVTAAMADEQEIAPTRDGADAALATSAQALPTVESSERAATAATESNLTPNAAGRVEVAMPGGAVGRAATRPQAAEGNAGRVIDPAAREVAMTAAEVAESLPAGAEARRAATDDALATESNPSAAATTTPTAVAARAATAADRVVGTLPASPTASPSAPAGQLARASRNGVDLAPQASRSSLEPAASARRANPGAVAMADERAAVALPASNAADAAEPAIERVARALTGPVSRPRTPSANERGTVQPRRFEVALQRPASALSRANRRASGPSPSRRPSMRPQLRPGRVAAALPDLADGRRDITNPSRPDRAGAAGQDAPLAPPKIARLSLAPRAAMLDEPRRSPFLGAFGSAIPPVTLPGSLVERAEPEFRVDVAVAAPVAEATAYSNRFGPAKAEALERFGGTAETERAVADGLRYLARIQNRNGSWGDNRGFDDKYGLVYVGKSALCVLAFLGAGHTPESDTEHSAVVARALAHLLAIQDEDTGAFGPSSCYGHGIATYALAECYGMTKDEALLRPLEEALTWIIVNQGPRNDQRNRGGWGYFSPGLRREDSYARVSVTSWMVMALESARMSGVELPDDVLPQAREYLQNSFDARRNWFRYNHKPSRLRSGWPTLPASTPAGAFCLQLLGTKAEDPMIAAALEYTVDRRPREYRRYRDDDFVLRGQGNVYFWYYGTLCCFLAGGETWERWNARLSTLLPAAQSEDGSFAPIDVYARYAGDNDRDRSYTTAMCVLSLEVYYRYFTPLLLGR